MSYDYAAKATLAREKIARYGAGVVFRKAQRNYNPVAGTYAEQLADLPVKAVLTRPEEKLLSAGVVQAGDAMLLAADLPAVPEPGDTVLVGGVEWRVISAAVVAPGQVALLYKIYIRRS